MSERIPFGEIFFAFLKLGLTSFGGPVAHIGYFRDEFIIRRRWIEENTYADIVALCQFLPGPASSQVGMTIGLIRGGLRGGFAAWLGFTTPSAIVLIVFAYGISALNSWNLSGLLAGLKIVAVAVVAQAVWGMATKLCPDRKRVTLALLSTMGYLIWPLPMIQIVLIIIGGFTGWAILRDAKTSHARQALPVDRYKNLSVKCLILFASLLISLPILSVIFPHQALVLFDSFYRSGSLVFGGGHVVLPMLQSEVVPTGWINKDQFLAGYGAAQAVPGPLFTFAAYLGTVMTSQGWLGGLWCLIALYTPSFLLILGVIPYWEKLRQQPVAQAALKGVNAVVVGLLLAALYNPVWISAIGNTHDFILCLAAFGLLVIWKCPAWLVVLFSAAVGFVFLG